jgi:hypothetical protein
VLRKFRVAGLLKRKEWTLNLARWTESDLGGERGEQPCQWTSFQFATEGKLIDFKLARNPDVASFG